MSQAIVWTQPECSHCVRAIEALEQAGYWIEERDILSPQWAHARISFKMKYGTTPQVFVGGVHIGGADDTLAWLADQAGKL